MNDEQAIYYVKNPSKFLNETGLIFELNRQILNPFGLAITVDVKDEEDSKWDGSFRIIDARTDKEGVVYDPESFVAAMEKMNAFMESFGLNKLQEREEALGYVVQEHPEPFLKQNGVTLITYNPEYDSEVENSPDILVFLVPFDWLEKKTMEWFEWNVSQFLTEYTYDQSAHIYDLAKREEVIVHQDFAHDGF